MKPETARNIQLVRVNITDDLIDGHPAFQVWAAAVPRHEAVDAVKQKISRHWTAELMGRDLSPQEARLQLQAGEVRNVRL